LASKRNKSFISLFLENYDDLVKRLVWRLGSSEDADDVVQDTYIKLHDLDMMDDIRNPRSYLFRIADNMAVDRLRKRSSDKRYIVEGEQMPEAGSNEPSPENIVDYRQRLSRLEEILAKLPERQRDVFLMYKFDGMKHAQIAEKMGISRSTVEKLIMNTMAACRDQMADLIRNDE